MLSNSAKGKFGEELALKYYLENGYKLVTQNFQYYSKGQSGRKGEIDLILSKDNILVLVEVKARSSTKFGRAIEQINPNKIRVLFGAYQYFCLKYPAFKNFYTRFDIAAIDSGKLEIISNSLTFDNLGR